jgi:hypothetical protein
MMARTSSLASRASRQNPSGAQSALEVHVRVMSLEHTTGGGCAAGD